MVRYSVLVVGWRQHDHLKSDGWDLGSPNCQEGLEDSHNDGWDGVEKGSALRCGSTDEADQQDQLECCRKSWIWVELTQPIVACLVVVSLPYRVPLLCSPTFSEFLMRFAQQLLVVLVL